MTKRVSATTIPLLIKSLLDKPQTALELVASTGLGADGVHKFIAAMKKEGLLHVVRWDYKVTQPVAVYAFGYGANTRVRWNETQKKLIDLFGDTPISYDNVQLSEKLNLGRSTIRKAMNGLTEQHYFIQNPGKATAPVSWRRNLDVALPDRGAATSNAGYKPAPAPRPARQSWFSAIV
jgi:DNA-binding IclR family transcriptional regulator